jgi:hypothetical protein
LAVSISAAAFAATVDKVVIVASVSLSFSSVCLYSAVSRPTAARLSRRRFSSSTSLAGQGSALAMTAAYAKRHAKSRVADQRYAPSRPSIHADLTDAIEIEVVAGIEGREDSG